MVPLIIDTDMGTDCGDAGALRVAHSLMDQGDCNILATTCPATYDFSPGCIDAINKFHGRGYIPVGQNKGAAVAPGPDPTVYNQYVATNFSNRYPTAGTAPDAVTVLRRALVGAADNSVIFCALGQLANLQHLMVSAGDSISTLTGLNLMLKKLKAVYVMAGDFPNGNEYNIYTDWTTAQYFFANFNGPVFVTGFTDGLNIKTGQAIVTLAPTTDPVYWCYKKFKDAGNALPRESWDALTLYAAVRNDFPFYPSTGRRLTVYSDGTNSWQLDATSQQTAIRLAGYYTEMASVIDYLILKPNY